MSIYHQGVGAFAPHRALARKAKYASTAVAIIAMTMGMAMLPGTARAALDTGTFSGTIGGVSSLNFGGVPYSPGDDYTGTFSYDPLNFDNTFTATITDTTSSQSFMFPAGATVSGGVSGTAGAFSLTATDDLEFPSTFTPFTATLSLSGSADPSTFPSVVTLLAGAGSLFIDVPAEPINSLNHTGNPEETLDVGLNIPEPASIGLFGLALAGLARARRRAKR
jgi:hypothetical protein